MYFDMKSLYLRLKFDLKQSGVVRCNLINVKTIMVLQTRKHVHDHIISVTHFPNRPTSKIVPSIDVKKMSSVESDVHLND